MVVVKGPALPVPVEVMTPPPNPTPVVLSPGEVVYVVVKLPPAPAVPEGDSPVDVTVMKPPAPVAFPEKPDEIGPVIVLIELDIIPVIDADVETTPVAVLARVPLAVPVPLPIYHVS